MNIENKTVLITGASSGLGREIALQLATRNNNIVITARREAKLNEVAAQIEAAGSRCLVVPADATNAEQVQAVLDRAIATFGDIDVALMNAGGGEVLNTATATSDQVLWTMRTNYDSLVLFLFPLIAHMKDRPGVIAYTSSPAGFFGLPKSGPYSAAKSAGRVLFDTCRIELSKYPVQLVALYPGFVYTPGMDGEDVPIKALIIQKDRAAREMIRAMERGTSHAMFPKRIKYLMLFARVLPEPVRRFIFARV